jgi:hypothetical protein
MGMSCTLSALLVAVTTTSSSWAQALDPELTQAMETARRVSDIRDNLNSFMGYPSVGGFF